jgi:hypothetical protein
MRSTNMPDWVQGQSAHPSIAILTVAVVVLALLIVAKSRTVGLAEATGSSSQSTLSIYDLGKGHPNMKNLPVLEIPLP